MRLADLEQAMVGRHVDGELGLVATADHVTPLQPIDDVRATADYRRRAALIVIRRLLNELGAAT
jgi:CO/xanthine dehydrogenase FAD-binding subunit